MGQLLELGRVPFYQPDNWDPLSHEAISSSGEPSKSHARSDLMLRAFHGYINECDEIIRRIRAEIAFMNSGDVDLAVLRSIMEKLEKLCFQADCWHFEELYWAAFQMKERLLELESPAQTPCRCSEKTLDNGMEMLARILHECENNYRLRLTMADILEGIGATEEI
jgi:hypothetical protein